MLLTLLQSQAATQAGYYSQFVWHYGGAGAYTTSQDLSFSAAGVIWENGIVVFEPGAEELTFVSGRVTWGVGSGSLDSVNELAFTAAFETWGVGSGSLDSVNGGTDGVLVVVTPWIRWSVDVSVTLSPQVDGPVLIGTSTVPHSLFGTG